MTKLEIYIGAIFIYILIISIIEILRIYLVNREINKSLKNIKRKHDNDRGILKNVTSDLAKNNLKKMIDALTRLSIPDKNSTITNHQLNLLRAGFRENKYITLFFGLKSLLFLLFPILGLLLIPLLNFDVEFTHTLLIILIFASIGYYLPDFVISNIKSKREYEVQKNLPQFIDLLVVCVESGMSIDAALSKVTTEIIRTSKILSEEFKILMLEINSGYSRDQAFNNLATRVNNDDLRSTINIIQQVTRTGTNLSEGLKIQSESLRVKRLQGAEEQAAKVATKMLIPLVLFMFPSLLIIILGPAVIMTMENF